MSFFLTRVNYAANILRKNVIHAVLTGYEVYGLLAHHDRCPVRGVISAAASVLAGPRWSDYDEPLPADAIKEAVR